MTNGYSAYDMKEIHLLKRDKSLSTKIVAGPSETLPQCLLLASTAMLRARGAFCGKLQL